MNIPSFQVKPDHVVTMAPGSSAEQVIRDATDLTASVAPWLQADHESLTGKVLKWPERSGDRHARPGTAHRRALFEVTQRKDRFGFPRTSLMDFQIPRIVHEEVDERRGVFVIEPLDRGFGHTFGNSLRRVLLSSLEGAAVLGEDRGRRARVHDAARRP